ncbi:SHOCT domain-containing protein [Nocardioides nitrophenolicus]|uniref:SHOCT domain-containing protein n=1 Tax=Nocardioides nitrophenolicus TaxID=60489 RepID=UPI00195A4F60|nr:SHOCT domain-containing protein [Nocardioides nitrophenolicus]MBM7515673.1 putative membrane protein [Nocardioides nitrophenolicus]
MMWNDDHYYFGWPGMLLMMAVVWSLAGAGVYLGARWLGRARTTADPLAILDERLARGEIDVEEYTRLWQAITDRRPAVRSR